MSDGGYRGPELWLSDGWALVTTEGWDAPLYWDRPHDGTDAEWTVFTLVGPRPVDPSEPVVHVSYHEADAFARWRGARLPTESEWEAVAAANWWSPDRVDRTHVHPDRGRVAGHGRPGAVRDRGVAVDPERLPPVPGLRPRDRARSVSTTASSW